jgi:ABC-type uncharacterized transport system substrate-binding protein
MIPPLSKYMPSAIRTIVILTAISGCLMQAEAQELKGKKVLYVNSYHAGYSWSDSIQKSIQKTLGETGAEIKIAELDTYRQKTPEHLAKAAGECKATIETWQPDVVIVSDDPAMKGLFAPFFKDSKVPFVFCGVNWSAAAYGVPCKNITGMLEVCPVKEILVEMNKLKPGKTVGFLASDTMTPRIDGENCARILGMKLELVLARDFAAWKQGFLDLQSKVDLLLIGPNPGITDWDETAACKFVEENTKAVTGSWHDYLNGLSEVAYNKVPEEQGEWAAKAAIRIIKGAAPDSIPIVSNQQGQLVINARIAKKAGLTPSFEVLQNAKIIE